MADLLDGQVGPIMQQLLCLNDDIVGYALAGADARVFFDEAAEVFR